MKTTVFVAMHLLLLSETLCCSASSLSWIAIASVSSSKPVLDESDCDNIRGLLKRQREVCRKHIEIMMAVRYGLLDAVDECQFQFRNSRWNCPVQNSAAAFGNVSDSGTREAAFVHAIVSAGVSHSVTRQCSSGQLKGCGCDQSLQGPSGEGFQWSGCSDNTAYGNAFTKTFIDIRDSARRRRKLTLVNLHNSNAGRQVLEANRSIQCKCHGISGSCELKTCWRALPTIRQIGSILHDKYDRATRVKLSNSGSRRQLAPRQPHEQPSTETDLVYAKPSAKYCDADPRSGATGTTGRTCNRTSSGPDGCEELCCGRGFVTRVRTVTERCRCRFHYCLRHVPRVYTRCRGQHLSVTETMQLQNVYF